MNDLNISFDLDIVKGLGLWFCRMSLSLGLFDIPQD